jgi:hypothetical protein
MTEQFKTVIKNNQDQFVILQSPKNYIHRMLRILPSSSLTVVFDDANHFLAPYSKITYFKSGKISCQKRSGFKRNLEFPICRFLNDGATDTEVLRIADHDAQVLPRGIEVVRHVPIHSHFADYESVTIGKPKEVVVPIYNNPGQHKTELRQNIVYKKRPEKELQRIQQMREASYLRSVGLGTPVGD